MSFLQVSHYSALFASFTTNCTMTFLLFKPIPTVSFSILPCTHLLLHTLAVYHVAIHLPPLFQPCYLLAIATLRQLLACVNILCATKNCSSALFVFFSKSFSLLLMLLSVFSACSTAFHRFSSFFSSYLSLALLNNLSSSFYLLM